MLQWSSHEKQTWKMAVLKELYLSKYIIFGIDSMKALISTVSLKMQLHSSSMNVTYPCIQSVIVTGWYRVWLLAGPRGFSLLRNVQTGFGVDHATYSLGTRDALAWAWGWPLNICLVPRLSGAVPLLSLYVKMACAGMALPLCLYVSWN